jgi:hypothetical protein
MSYVASLIERLTASGHWEQMPVEDQAKFRGMSDDEARRLMVVYDELDMGDPAMVRRISQAATDALFGLFDRALFAFQEGRMLFTPIGEMLSSIVAELQAAGVDCLKIGDDFGKVRVALIDRLRNSDAESASGVFLGKLVEYDEQRRLRPSPIGESLNRLVRALQAKGIRDAEIDAGFDELNPIVVEFLIASRERWKR